MPAMTPAGDAARRDDGAKATTVKVTRTLARKLGVLSRGAGFPSIAALVDHMTRVVTDNPELLRKGAK